MKVLILDVLHDLRTKRLWPAAAALAAAIVLVPVGLLVFGAPDAPESVPGPRIAAPATGVASEVKVATRPGAGSDLDAFESHNPFRPKGGPAPDESAESGAPGGEEVTPSSGSGAAPAPVSDSGSDGDSSEPSTGDSAKDASGADKGDAPAQPKSTPEAEPRVPVRSAQARLALLSHEVKAAYGRPGDVRSRVLDPLQVFPSNRRLFMLSGVDENGKEATFAILDSSLVAQAGDGRCLHVGGRCTVLRLREGQSRRFRDESGQVWVLRLGSLELVDELIDVDQADRGIRELVDRLGG